MKPLHNRMPVIVPPDQYDQWLGEGEAAVPGPYPTEAMEAYPVSTWVNAPAHDDPRCIEPVVLLEGRRESENGGETLFGR